MERLGAGLGCAFVAAGMIASGAAAQTTTRVSVDATGVQGNLLSNGAALSSDGRYVAFYSDASNLVPNDTNAFRDCFVYDRLTSTIARISVDSTGAQANGPSGGCAISGDGRWVVYHSDASNLVANDTNTVRDAFMYDRLTGTTTRISVDSNGVQGNGISDGPSVSSDGHYVAFYSDATNLVPNDTNAVRDVFLRDTQAGTTIRVSVDSTGAQSNGKSEACVISPDGHWILYASDATNLVPGDTNGVRDVFRYDRLTGTTDRISVDSNGVQGNGVSALIEVTGTSPNTTPINGVTTTSFDGRYVAFYSLATNLVVGDVNGFRDVFVRDTVAGTTVLVSVDSNGVQGNEDSSAPNMSSDGRYVAFYSDATNLVPGDTNLLRDVFVHDMQTGTTVRVSVDTNGNQGNNRSGFHAISASGRFIAFSSDATNLVAGDTNLVEDVFVRDQGAAPPTNFCFGDGSLVTPCPCANFGATGHGCANSSAGSTGALLVFSGSTVPDTLVLSASSMIGSATSVYLQGSAVLSNGTFFGDGLRCASGSLKRIGVKMSSGGASHYPATGDPSISARSAALGDPILGSGLTRYYQTYYRDSNLAFCPDPPGNSWNVSNGLIVVW
jgi:Tol biopolymer transport system component